MSPLLAHASGADESLSLILLFSAIWTGWIGWSRLRETGFMRMPRWAGFAMFVAAGALVVVAAVVPRALLGAPNGATAASSGSRPASTATLAFAAPRQGTVTSNDQLTVRLDLQGATVTSVTSTNVSPDTGHIHLSLDGALISMAGGTLQEVDLRSLGSGPHTLRAEFVAADHLAFNPPVTAEVTFVTEAAP